MIVPLSDGISSPVSRPEMAIVVGTATAATVPSPAQRTHRGILVTTMVSASIGDGLRSRFASHGLAERLRPMTLKETLSGEI